MRLQRGEVPVFLDENHYRFELGRAKVLNSNGGDVLIVSLGLMTRHALSALVDLDKEGIRATLIHVSTLKPLDEELILEHVERIPFVVSCENHTVIGGLGSALAEAVTSAGIPMTLRRVGVQDVYATCGSTAYLFKKHGLDSTAIVSETKELLRASTRLVR